MCHDVGAAIGRPAVNCCVFALVKANTQHFPTRTSDARPYEMNKKGFLRRGSLLKGCVN